MKVAVFFVYLFFHLLGGGNSLYAGTHHNSDNGTAVSSLAQKGPVKFTDTNHISTIIEDADLDLDEECFSNNTVKTGGSNKYTDGKYSLSYKWYLTCSRTYILKDYGRHFKISPLFCGNSSPIYIRQRVLRI